MSDQNYDINDDVKRDVLHATDLVQLIGASTSLKKMGKSWKGLCPFHGEKSPSFYVHPDKGFYYCFGCGAKGDAITFVRETERLDFPEAVAYLARQAGIALPVRKGGTRADRGRTRGPPRRSRPRPRSSAGTSRGTRRRASCFRQARPLAGGGGGLRLRSRARIVGRAEDGLGTRYTEETLVDAGLVQKNPESGRVYDRFRNRLTSRFATRAARSSASARARSATISPSTSTRPRRRASRRASSCTASTARARRSAGRTPFSSSRATSTASRASGRALAKRSPPWGPRSRPRRPISSPGRPATVVVAYDGDAPGVAAAYKAFPLLLSRGAT